MTLYRTLFLLLCFIQIGVSQNLGTKNSQLDSLKLKLEKDSARIYRKTIAKPYLRVESRRSFISEQSIALLGFLAGVTLYEKHILCAGFYASDRRSKESFNLIDNNRFVNQYLKLNYYNFAYQYILLNMQYMQLNIPLEVGYGNYRIRITDSLNRPIRFLSGDFVPLNAGILCILKPVRWAGISLLGGYRYVRPENERQIELNFRGWYYSIGVWLDARQLLHNGRYYMNKRRYHREVKALLSD